MVTFSLYARSQRTDRFKIITYQELRVSELVSQPSNHLSIVLISDRIWCPIKVMLI